ncbi:MAG: hypothetical protein U0794_18930 [Isosphaeraceae bacterium]
MRNDGVHRLDYARRGLEAALGGDLLGMPTVASATGGSATSTTPRSSPTRCSRRLDYPDRKATILYEMRVWTPYRLDDEPEGAAIFGDKGYVVLSNARWRSVAPDGKIVAQGGSPMADYDRAHKADFPDAIRNHRRPNCDIAQDTSAHSLPPRQHRLGATGRTAGCPT